MRGFSRRAVAPVVVCAALYLLWGYSYGQQHNRAGDPGEFIHAGSAFKAPRSILPSGVTVYPGTGYDGQTVFYIALDPFLTKGYDRYVDQPAYRYQRILLPLMGWLTSLGNPNLLKFSLPAINLIAILLSGLLLARFLAEKGRSVWWSLGYMLSCGLVLAYLYDVGDGLATSLLLAGVIFWVRRRTRLAIVCLTLTVLARESALAAVALIAVLELYRDRRRALIWLTPLGVGLVWQIYVSTIFSFNQFHDVGLPGVIPFGGAVDKLRYVTSADVVGASNWEALFVLLLLVASLFVIVRCVEEARLMIPLGGGSAEHRRPPVLPGLAYAVLIIFLSSGLWGDIAGFPRYGAPIAAFLVLDWAVSRRRASVMLATAMVSLTFFSPLFGLLPDKLGGVVLNPAAPAPPLR